MRSGESRGPSSQPCDEELLHEIFHELSQPLTTLECGLELAIRYDTTLAQVRKRLKVLLEAANVMHQRLAALRVLQQEPEPRVRNVQRGTVKTGQS